MGQEGQEMAALALEECNLDKNFDKLGFVRLDGVTNHHSIKMESCKRKISFANKAVLCTV